MARLSRSKYRDGLVALAAMSLLACAWVPEEDSSLRDDTANGGEPRGDGSGEGSAAEEERDEIALAGSSDPLDPAAACEATLAPEDTLASEAEQSFALQADRAPAVVYLNMTGGTYRRVAPGGDDPAQNTSSLIYRDAVAIPAYGGDRAALLACVQRGFAPYNVTVVTREPAGRNHIEAVVAGSSATTVGRPSSLLGVSYSRCTGIRSTLNWTFAGAGRGRDVRSVCWTVLHEVGHALGLEHEYTARDWMSYLDYAGQKSYVNEDLVCATGNGQGWQQRRCDCQTNGLQNSHRRILTNFGAATAAPRAPDDRTPPAVSVVSPADGASFAASSTIDVVATARDDTALASVGLLWQIGNATPSLLPCPGSGAGWSCASAGGTYRWQLTVGTGARYFAVRATDAAGRTTETTARRLAFAAAAPPSVAATATILAPAPGSLIVPGQVFDVRAKVEGTPSAVRVLWESAGTVTAWSMQAAADGSYGLQLQLGAAAAPGPRSLRVEVVDRTGATTVTEPLTLTVDG